MGRGAGMGLRGPAPALLPLRLLSHLPSLPPSLQPPSFSPFLQSDYSVALRCIRTLVAGRGQDGRQNLDPVCNDPRGV